MEKEKKKKEKADSDDEEAHGAFGWLNQPQVSEKKLKANIVAASNKAVVQNLQNHERNKSIGD